MNSKKMVLAAALISLVGFASCSTTSKFYYRNNEYFPNKEKGKTLYIDDIERVTFDDTARAFSLYSLKMDSKQIEDTLTAVFEYVLKDLTKKYIKKVDVINSNSTIINNEIRSDSTKWQNVSLTSKDSVSKEFHIPYSEIFENMEIGKVDYLMQIKSPKISMSRYFVPIVLPLPGGFISGGSSGPCLVLHGSFILWDVSKNRAICAGDFSKQFTKMNTLLKRNSLITTFKSLVLRIFGKTPYRIVIPQ